MVLQDHQVDMELLGVDTEAVVMVVVDQAMVLQTLVMVLLILVTVLQTLATELLLVRYVIYKCR